MTITSAISNRAISYPGYTPTVKPQNNAVTPQDKTDDTAQQKNIARPENTDKESTRSGNDRELTAQEEQQVAELKKRDMEVKAHEMAHVAAGGQYISGQVNFQYQTGPDGKRYAVGGDVSIDISAVPGDPQATMSKMKVVRRAALAPQSPSQTDRIVASKALQIEAKARMEALIDTVRESSLSEEGSPKVNEKTGSREYADQSEIPPQKGGMIDIAA